MGNFSQDPLARVLDAVGKQYVAVRIQQAVPLVDADWNLLDDLRRAELENFGRLFIGSGIPAGSDGFRISAIAQANDFAIAPGVALVAGKTIRNDAALPVRYSQQPQFNTPGIGPLTTPTVNKGFFVVLDVWEREIDHLEDPALVDARIGVETSVRLRREWAVRVFRDPEDVPQIDTPPAGHVYLRLARLARLANNANITTAMITDLRDTQLTVLRKIEVRDPGGNLLVTNDLFAQALQNTRNNIQAFIKYITTQFNSIYVPMSSVEVLGLQAASHVAHTAEAGLAQVSTQSIANRGALNVLQQMYDAQQAFMQVWKDHVLQLGTTVKKYASYQSFVTNLNARLNNPSVGQLIGLAPAIAAGNLDAAVDMQNEIARLIGAAAATIARGSIQVSYVNAPPGNLTQGQVVRFEFRVKSFTTQADTYTVSVLPPPGPGTWQRDVVDGANNPIPNNKVPIGAAGTETTIFVRTTVGAGSSGLQLRVTSDSNPAEIDQLTGLLTLTQGQPAPLGEDKIQLSLEQFTRATLNPATGVVSVQTPPAQQPAAIGVRIFNNTGQAATFALNAEIVPNTPVVGTWSVTRVGPASLPMNAGENQRPGAIAITAGADAVSVTVRYTVSATISGSPVTAQIVVPIVATP